MYFVDTMICFALITRHKKISFCIYYGMDIVSIDLMIVKYYCYCYYYNWCYVLQSSLSFKTEHHAHELKTSSLGAMANDANRKNRMC